jgi:23S rRNA U2552 (ribose-2'-O)-methylase RlmE/FtsJ
MATKKPDKRFDPTVLDRTVIARPLLEQLDERGDNALFDVVIDVNMNYTGGRDRARERVADLIAVALASSADARVRHGIGVDHRKTDLSDQYVRAPRRRALRARASRRRGGGGGRVEFSARVIFTSGPTSRGAHGTP